MAEEKGLNKPVKLKADLAAIMGLNKSIAEPEDEPGELLEVKKIEDKKE